MLKDGKITKEQAQERWDNPSGSWNDTIPSPQGPRPVPRKTAVRSAVEDSDAGRKIGNQPADAFKMNDEMRTWLKDQGLDFEGGPAK